ncbi:S1 RNA-binding domain-containing protein, partial [Candidatus Sumerlaeota bacterium]|nr:S1 RNA-binding domain-containing protein [Candidatus Sumerlaeota bacterium]
FTSPIRRYPDLIVHRAVKSLLGSRDDRDAYIRYSSDLLPEWGRHTSSREERAQRIEWDAQKILTLEFMKRFIGDVFDGHISGLLGRGFFVEFVDYPAEGFVPIQTLEDDYYDFDSETMAFYGRRGNRAYALGDPVKAQIERIDVLAGEMDLRLVRKESKGESGKPPKSRGKAKGNKNNWRKQMRRRIGKRR